MSLTGLSFKDVRDIFNYVSRSISHEMLDIEISPGRNRPISLYDKAGTLNLVVKKFLDISENGAIPDEITVSTSTHSSALVANTQIYLVSIDVTNSGNDWSSKYGIVNSMYTMSTFDTESGDNGVYVIYISPKCYSKYIDDDDIFLEKMYLLIHGLYCNIITGVGTKMINKYVIMHESQMIEAMHQFDDKISDILANIFMYSSFGVVDKRSVLFIPEAKKLLDMIKNKDVFDEYVSMQRISRTQDGYPVLVDTGLGRQNILERIISELCDVSIMTGDIQKQYTMESPKLSKDISLYVNAGINVADKD